jgi:hypothetical protein
MNNQRTNHNKDKNLVSQVRSKDRLAIALTIVIFGSVATIATIFVSNRPSVNVECNSKITTNASKSPVICGNYNINTESR